MMCLDNTSHYFSSIRDALNSSKELTRRELLEEEKKRNQYLRELLSENESSLIEVRVYLDAELRNTLNIKKEKRGRMFIPKDGTNTKTLAGIMKEIKLYFPVLRACYSLSLRADLPILLADGSVLCPEDSQDETRKDPYEHYRSIDNDESVMKIFEDADDFFLSHNQHLKRPLVILHVRGDLEIPLPSYLKDMANPKDTKTMTMLSFYSFPPGGISDPGNFIRFLKKIWEPFDVLGRVYVATEGVNAQMAVPSNV